MKISSEWCRVEKLQQYIYVYVNIRIKPGLSYQANVLALAIALVLIRHVYRIEHFISSHQKASRQFAMSGHGDEGRERATAANTKFKAKHTRICYSHIRFCINTHTLLRAHVNE